MWTNNHPEMITESCEELLEREKQPRGSLYEEGDLEASREPGFDLTATDEVRHISILARP